MPKTADKSYINVTISDYLLRSLKILASQKGMRVSQLLEEAIIDLLNKYKTRVKE